nr:uncharacterized protein LOC109161017 [Ipomoea batatas]
MLLSSLKPPVGSLPSSYRFNGPSGNGSVSAMLRVNGKASKSTTLQLKGGEEKFQAQETLPAVLIRDAMLLTAVGLALSLPMPAGALEIDVRSIFAGILEARREARRAKARFLKRKTEVDRKPKNESKAESPSAKNEVEGEENKVNVTSNDEKLKAESDGEAAKNEGDEKEPRGDVPPLPPLLFPNLLSGTPQVAHAQ